MPGRENCHRTPGGHVLPWCPVISSADGRRAARRVAAAGTPRTTGRRHRRQRARQHGGRAAPAARAGVTIADIMLHGRHDDPDPVIAAWLADNTASRRNTSSPADVLIHWDQASPALQAALARPTLPARSARPWRRCNRRGGASMRAAAKAGRIRNRQPPAEVPSMAGASQSI
jgi:hypothetical protein